ncbi:hypothetical protein [Actinocorallia lasiicapitis]
MPWPAQDGGNVAVPGEGWAAQGGGAPAWQAAQAAEQRSPEEAWQQWGGREERPLWDPNGPMPTTTSHRAASSGDGGRKVQPLVIGVVVLVVLAIIAVLFVVLGGDGDKAEPGKKDGKGVQQEQKAEDEPVQQPVDPAARAQAVKVNSLLKASALSRRTLGSALVLAKKCEKLPEAITGMQQVAQQRQDQLSRSQQLDYSKLANGDGLKKALVKSMQFSLSVDQAFLQWAQAHQGCTGATPVDDPHYKQGVNLSNQATKAKAQFLAGWNQVAPALGIKKAPKF